MAGPAAGHRLGAARFATRAGEVPPRGRDHHHHDRQAALRVPAARAAPPKAGGLRRPVEPAPARLPGRRARPLVRVRANKVVGRQHSRTGRVLVRMVDPARRIRARTGHRTARTTEATGGATVANVETMDGRPVLTFAVSGTKGMKIGGGATVEGSSLERSSGRCRGIIPR